MVHSLSRRTLFGGVGATVGLLSLAACGGSDTDSTGATSTLSVSAIPDQDPELLNRLYPTLAKRFSTAIDSPVTYQPVTDYTAVVRAFEIGDVHVAWMGGLTGVQARSRVPGAHALVQRDHARARTHTHTPVCAHAPHTPAAVRHARAPMGT